MGDTQMSQEEVLMILATFSPLSSRQLSEGMGLSCSSIHQSLKRLKKQGEVWWMQGKPTPGISGGSPAMWGAI